jgi:hypothetical protein
MEGKKPMFGFSINWRIALYATLLNRGYEMVVSLNGAMVFDSIAWFVTGAIPQLIELPSIGFFPPFNKFLISRNISGGSKQFSN